MPKREEPHEKRTDSDSQGDDPATLISLVDLFDQIDRAAFRRSLRHRDGEEHAVSTS